MPTTRAAYRPPFRLGDRDGVSTTSLFPYIFQARRSPDSICGAFGFVFLLVFVFGAVFFRVVGSLASSKRLKGCPTYCWMRFSLVRGRPIKTRSGLFVSASPDVAVRGCRRQESFTNHGLCAGLAMFCRSCREKGITRSPAPLGVSGFDDYG